MALIEYRCEATTVEGFLQQLACRYINNGYRYYSEGLLHDRVEADAVDSRIIRKYRINIDKWERHRRKRAGLANVQYLRYRRFFLILATGPRDAHSFFSHEPHYRDAHEVPIRFSGHAVSFTTEGVRVRIDRSCLRRLEDYFLAVALRRTSSQLVREFRTLPFEPYKPVRYHLFRLLNAVNRRRRASGLTPVPDMAIRRYRRIVRPFDEPDLWSSASHPFGATEPSQPFVQGGNP